MSKVKSYPLSLTWLAMSTCAIENNELKINGNITLFSMKNVLSLMSMWWQWQNLYYQPIVLCWYSDVIMACDVTKSPSDWPIESLWHILWNRWYNQLNKPMDVCWPTYASTICIIIDLDKGLWACLTQTLSKAMFKFVQFDIKIITIKMITFHLRKNHFEIS